MFSKPIVVLVVLALLYMLWRRRSEAAITSGREWNAYQPRTFRVIEGGGDSIVPVDDK